MENYRHRLKKSTQKHSRRKFTHYKDLRTGEICSVNYLIETIGDSKKGKEYILDNIGCPDCGVKLEYVLFRFSANPFLRRGSQQHYEDCEYRSLDGQSKRKRLNNKANSCKEFDIATGENFLKSILFAREKISGKLDSPQNVTTIENNASEIENKYGESKSSYIKRKLNYMTMEKIYNEGNCFYGAVTIKLVLSRREGKFPFLMFFDKEAGKYICGLFFASQNVYSHFYNMYSLESGKEYFGNIAFISTIEENRKGNKTYYNAYLKHSKKVLIEGLTLVANNNEINSD
ncbi:MAG: hypothetical protein LBB10_02300 [Bifidobacteriaceae bacterium]|jgi:hypothetical protein|nr:hypothetical protein [Bifidobacteriaceae bacterium]